MTIRVARRTGLTYRNVRRPPRRQVAPVIPISERMLQDHVMLTAALWGWHGIHIIRSNVDGRSVVEGIHSPRRPFPRGGDHDDALGFPDLVLIHPVRHLVALVELKTSRGRQTEDQKRWEYWAKDLGACRSFCWRPEDEVEIQRILSQGWRTA